MHHILAIIIIANKVLATPTGSASVLNISAVPLNRSLQDIFVLPEDVEKVRMTKKKTKLQYFSIFIVVKPSDRKHFSTITVICY